MKTGSDFGCRIAAEKEQTMKTEQYIHSIKEYPVLSRQTHFVIRDGKITSEVIGINENIMHYVQDTALLISRIDGSVNGETTTPDAFDHVVYLDKSARPVSWLVNLFWSSFAALDENGVQAKRPRHTYVNIDRSPWFRHVGIAVSDDGRQKSNGELATYSDFIRNKDNLTNRHLAAIRSLFIEGGIEEEDPDKIMKTPTIIDGKRLLIVDEVSRTGSTLSIAEFLFKQAIPEAKYVKGTYFWNPGEPPIKIGNENMLTSLPVWYDPQTVKGRGIGDLNEKYYRDRYEHYLELYKKDNIYDIKKLRTHAFAALVFSAPLLNPDGSVMSLEKERISRQLAKDLVKLADDYKKGTIFFTPPNIWDEERVEKAILAQGALLIPETASDREIARIRKSDKFYLNVVNSIKAR